MSLTLRGTGIYGDREAQVDPSHRALRMSIRPAEKGVYGSYSLYAPTGTIAAGLTGPLPIFQVRWASQSVVFILRKLRLTVGNTATAFTAGLASFDVRRLTGFTVADLTNGTQVVFTSGKSNVKSSRFVPTQFTQSGSVYVLNTSASGLTGGTKTADTNAVAGAQISLTATAGSVITPGVNLIDPADAGREPLEFYTNEGFEVRCVAIPATGTWAAGLEMEWDEVDPARYFN
jgi:hypothetical protein